MVPLVELTLRPAGKLVAEYVTASPAESVAVSGWYTVSPVALVCEPGLVSVTHGLTVHCTVSLPPTLVLTPSLAVSVTE